MDYHFLKGTGVALVTPFNDQLEVDTQALTQLVHFVIENGVEYLVVLGTTAEAATLSAEEKQLVKQTILKANNARVPMVIGIGGNNTQHIVQEISSTNLSDYSAILSVSPYYNKPSQEGIFQHYKAISKVSPLPIIAYNVPGRTGSNILPQTTLRLALECENIIAIKEASGNFSQIMEILQHKPSNFEVISGDDALALPTVLMGGSGVISVLGQALPKQFSEMIRLGLQGDISLSTSIHYQMMDLFSLIFKEGNPVGIKSLLKSLGIGNGKVRLPLVEASKSLEDNLRKYI